MKFIALIAMVIMVFVSAVGCSSCTPNNANFGIEYSLQSDGTADGNVDVIFDGGSFAIDGSASYVFAWHNTILFTKGSHDAINLDTALCAKDEKVASAAAKVSDWIDSSIQVSSASGTYDIYIKGYVKETATQITFTIDRHFTNKAPISKAPDDSSANAVQ